MEPAELSVSDCQAHTYNDAETAVTWKFANCLFLHNYLDAQRSN